MLTLPDDLEPGFFLGSLLFDVFDMNSVGCRDRVFISRPAFKVPTDTQAMIAHVLRGFFLTVSAVDQAGSE